jgi:RimK family alpha-L-glutamate ligase
MTILHDHRNVQALRAPASCYFKSFLYDCGMNNERKFVFLNAGTETRKALIAGIGDSLYEWYHTKNMILHINKEGTPLFVYKNSPISFDGAHVFTRLRAQDQQFCGILYDYFKHNHIPANDPINHSYENSAEKISQMLLLALAGIRIPETIIFREEGYRKNRAYIEEHCIFPLVFKTDGSKGKNVHYVTTIEELDELVDKKKPYIRALTQPFIPNTFDTRTIVAFGTVLGSIKRARTEGHLNNIAQGAQASPYELSEDEKNSAIRSAEICGIDVAGVDIIHTPDGPIVLEVNKSPQVHGFESVHTFKVFEKVAELMKKYD